MGESSELSVMHACNFKQLGHEHPHCPGYRFYIKTCELIELVFIKTTGTLSLKI